MPSTGLCACRLSSRRLREASQPWYCADSEGRAAVSCAHARRSGPWRETPRASRWTVPEGQLHACTFSGA